MSLWIRALCRRPLGANFAPGPLTAALAQLDFAMMAEAQGLDDEAGYAAEDALRIEAEADAPNLLFLYCRPENPEYFIRIESWQGDQMAGEIEELVEATEDAEGAGAARVRGHLTGVVQSVAFELKASDTERMGVQIAFHAAMWMAEQGDGLVEFEDEWFDPAVSTFKPILTG